jgi:DNA-binding response OmpR family regulator
MVDKKRVLIVEDDPIIALDLSRILKSAGMTVVGPAMTVRDAEKLARDNETDAAVLDVRLEVGGTVALARDLRAKGISFLFQTSDPRLLVGFEPTPIVLAKPFPSDKLVSAVGNLLGIPVSRVNAQRQSEHRRR